MISLSDLKKLAKARLVDAQELNNVGRYDGAMYMGGYVVEIALKARICKTLKWSGFPDKPKEFEHFKSFKIHDLDVLLQLSGRERSIKAKYMVEWSRVVAWNPETRYKIPGTTTAMDASHLLKSAQLLLKVL